MTEKTQTPVALVTGGSRGIGASVVETLARGGHHVVINCRAGTDLAHALQARLEADGLSAEVQVADVSDRAAVDAMFASILERHGRLDVLVNNAGIAQDHLVATMPAGAWRSVMDVNFGGAFNCTQAAIATFARQRSGRIVNVSSIMSEHGWIGQANYAASKAALNALTRVCAVELARFGVTTNAVLAGMVPTELVAGLMAKNEGRGVSQQVPSRRFAQAAEVADAVAFLASASSGYVNGALLTVDGGMSAQLGQGAAL